MRRLPMNQRDQNRTPEGRSPLDVLEAGALRALCRVLDAPWTVLVLTVLATLAALVYARSTLDFSFSRQGLDDQQGWLAAARQAYNEEFPDTDADRLVVVIEAPTPARAKSFAAELAARLEADRAHVVWARYGEDARELRRNSLLYLSAADLDRLEAGLWEHRELLEDLARQPGLVTLLEGVNHEMSRGVVSHFFTDFLNESSASAEQPLDLALLKSLLGNLDSWAKGDTDSFTSPWSTAFGSADWGSEDQALYWVDDKKFLLVQVRITAEHVPAAEKADAVEAVRNTVAAVRERYPEVRAGVTGGPALDVDELASIRADMKLASLLSLAGVALLLVIGFRGVVKPAFGLFALNLGVIWAFAFTAATVGHLTIMSAPLAPILIGLGMDDGIHLLSRYEEGRRLGYRVRDALEHALAVVLRPLVATATSIAAALFALCFSGVRALIELGWITGTGMLLVLASTLVAFPPLLLLYDGWREKRHTLLRRIELATADPPIALPLYRRSRTVLAACAVAAILGAFGMRRIGYDFDLLNLQAKGTESVDWELRLLHDGNRSATAYGVVLADSLEEARRKARALEALPTVSKATSAASLIPENQAEKVERIHRLAPLLDGLPESLPAARKLDPGELRDVLGRIRAKLDASAADDEATRRDLLAVRSTVGSLLARVDDPPALARLAVYERLVLSDLAEKLGVLRESRDIAPFGLDQLPPAFRDRFVGKHGRYLVEAFPAGNFWEPDFQARFVADLRSVDQRAVGEPVLLHASTLALEHGYALAGVLALAALIAVMALTFAAARDVLLATVPLVVGSLWTVGLMALFGLRFNLGNLLTLPLMVGAGMENGIVLVSRYREGRAKPFAVPRSSGLGVFLASMTTVIGFGSLIIARHRGVHSVGLLLALAVGSVFVASFTALPAALRLMPLRRASLKTVLDEGSEPKRERAYAAR
jgi:uncharacterized protein